MRRLFYVPGLLSLVALAPSLMWFLNSKEVWVKERCIQMTFPAEATSKEDSSWMSGRWNIPHRKWVELRFAGGLDDNKFMLDVFERLTPRYHGGSDTVTGVHVTLEPSIRWETVVAAVEILRANSVEAYVIDEHDITVYLPTFLHPSDADSDGEGSYTNDTLDVMPFYCGTYDQPRPVRDAQNVGPSAGGDIESRLAPILNSPLTTWPALLGLVVLTIVALKSSVK